MADFLYELLAKDRSVDVEEIDGFENSFRLFVDDWQVVVTVSEPEIYP